MDPELREFECGETDFLVLVCDGALEGESTNASIIQFIADCLNANPDPAHAAEAISPGLE